MHSYSAIEIEGVHKKYCTNLKLSMLYGVGDILSDFVGISGTQKELRSEEFWAIENLSFKVEKGGCLGVIGPNGAGKSTLLKLLSGIMKPDIGRINIRGKVGSLIEVGAGFHPMLTGRENIYLGSAIYGLPNKIVKTRFDEIVSFAGLEDYIDSPVKNYSSGMYARLGFSVAAHIEPDVLLVDEVLAVGDIEFQSRCLSKMQSLMGSGVSIIFVSHQLGIVDKISDRVLFLSKENPAQIGAASDMIDSYRKDESAKPQGGFKLEHKDIEVVNVGVESAGKIKPGQPVDVVATVNCKSEITVVPSFAIHLGYGEQIAASRLDRGGDGPITLPKGIGAIKMHLPRLSFAPGYYSISFRLFDQQGITPLVNHHISYPFTVSGGADTVGFIDLDASWSFSRE